jgi:hypothetical protein
MLIRLRDQALLNTFFKQKAHHKSYNIHKKNHPVITGRGIWLFWVLVDLYNKNYVRGNSYNVYFDFGDDLVLVA